MVPKTDGATDSQGVQSLFLRGKQQGMSEAQAMQAQMSMPQQVLLQG